MHLAFVTSLVTDGKPTTGFEVANESIVSGLRAIGCKVTEIGFQQPRQSPPADEHTIVLKTMDVENASASTLQKTAWMLGAVKSRLPVGGSKLQVVPWALLEDKLKSLGPIDGVIINSVQMPSAFPKLLSFAPFLYVAHNIEHLSARQNSQSADGRLKRFLYQRDARLLERVERNLFQNARHVFCLSNEDREQIEVFNKNVSVLNLLFPTQYKAGAPDPSKQQHIHDIGLIGTWSWQPNFVGLKWFLDEVVPHLNPDLSVSIAGNTPTMMHSAHPGVKFVGRVEDANEFVENSRILALVSRSGTGVQLKTIEAFQMGMPCCATSSSVRGVGSIPANCSVEDDAKAFAVALNTMVENVKTGKVSRLDGVSFTKKQRDALYAGLERGLASFAR